jgi:hypothetical protein
MERIERLPRRRCEMVKNIPAIGVATVLMVLGGLASAEVELVAEAARPPTVQVIRPEIEILGRPVIIEVQVEPSLGVDTSMRILCAMSTYRGEVHVEREDTRVSLSIAGEINELSAEEILVSFDVEARSEDVGGGAGFVSTGAAILEPGKPKSVLTIGGRSLFLTARFASEGSGARPEEEAEAK